MRQIVLDTETTGLDAQDGHRVIEIGCVELVNRRLTGNRFHTYLNPDREVEEGAFEVHGISTEMLMDKPRFNDIAEDLFQYLQGAELVIHNAPFDVGFLNSEFVRERSKWPGLMEYCVITDTLQMARKLHPGQKNNLDALCKRYGVDNSQRDLHGALLDAEILAEVYLAMTGGQTSLGLGADEMEAGSSNSASGVRKLKQNRPALKVIKATEPELVEHEAHLDLIAKSSGKTPIWRDSNAD